MDPLPRGEAFADTFEFRAGAPVPAWLIHTQGVRRLTFTARTTIFATMQGGFVVMPHSAVGSPVHVEGYGPRVLMEIVTLGLSPIRLLCGPIATGLPS